MFWRTEKYYQHLLYTNNFNKQYTLLSANNNNNIEEDCLLITGTLVFCGVGGYVLFIRRNMKKPIDRYGMLAVGLLCIAIGLYRGFIFDQHTKNKQS